MYEKQEQKVAHLNSYNSDVMSWLMVEIVLEGLDGSKHSLPKAIGTGVHLITLLVYRLT